MKLPREERTLLTGWPKVLRLDRRDPSTAGADAIVPTHRAAADPIGRDAIAWAARTLRRHGMPQEEIRAVLDADSPELVRRYLELHRSLVPAERD